MATAVRPSLAQSETIPVDLAFDAPSECGQKEALVQRIRSRSDKLQLIDDAAAQGVDVRIGQLENGYSANVTITTSNDDTERSFAAANCNELLDAVALVIVVTFDPTGRINEALPDEPGPASPVPAEPPAGGDTPLITTPPPEWRDEIVPPELGQPFEWSTLVPDRFGIGAGVRSHLGPAPGSMFGPELSLAVSWAPQQLASMLLGLYVSRSFSTEVSEPGGSASFTLDQLLVELCPLRFGGRSWEFRPCLQAAGGRFIASGSNTIEGREVTRPWGTFGVALRPSARPAPWLEVWAGYGIGVAMVRDEFQFEPAVFHTVPQEILTGAIGVSALFP